LHSVMMAIAADEIIPLSCSEKTLIPDEQLFGTDVKFP